MWREQNTAPSLFETDRAHKCFFQGVTSVALINKQKGKRSRQAGRANLIKFRVEGLLLDLRLILRLLPHVRFQRTTKQHEDNKHDNVHFN